MAFKFAWHNVEVHDLQQFGNEYFLELPVLVQIKLLADVLGVALHQLHFLGKSIRAAANPSQV